MRQLAVLAAAISILSFPTHAETTFEKVSGEWHANSGQRCTTPLDVRFTGYGEDGKVHWREGPMDSWHVQQVQSYVPQVGRFFGGRSDQTVSVQGETSPTEIRGSIVFYQRACSYLFVLKRS